MAEDWGAIASEVFEAIKSVGSTDDGYPVALRKASASSGDAWNPTEGTPTYHTLYAVQDMAKLRDINGTLIGQVMTKLCVGVGDVVPHEDDAVCPGLTAEEVDEDSDWREISMVQPLSPAGTAVMYEIDLVV